MRFMLAAVLALGLAASARAQTPLTGTTGPQTSTPPITSPAVMSRVPARAPRRTLQARFSAANATHDGHLTPAQAQAGMPTVARNFAAIDTGNKGYVTVDDIRAYNQARRAARTKSP